MTNPSDGARKNAESPIACDLSALSTPQRARRVALAASIQASVARIVETASGYELHLRRDEAVWRQAEELIALERKCCQFLTLELRREGTTGDRVLALSGEGEAKSFIAVAMGVLGAHGQVAGEHGREVAAPQLTADVRPHMRRLFGDSSC